MADPPYAAPSDNTTLTEVLAGYAEAGFTSSFAAQDGGAIRCDSCGSELDPEQVDMRSLRRLEGASDPADMMAIVAMRCGVCEAAGTMVTVFPPGFDEADALAAVVRADGLPVRTTWLGNVWVVHGPAPGFAGRVREEGAWLALAAVPFEPGLLGGCPFVPHLGPGEGSGLPAPYAPR